jgi:16S rRNA (guanine1516-N2)-methyltransferase
MCFSQIEQGSVPQVSRVAVVVESDDERLVEEATRVKILLGDTDKGAEMLLYFGQYGVELRHANTPDQKGFRVDFSTIERRTGTGNLSRRQPLPKAIGRQTTTVIDATAGFGRDAVMLALMGYHVVALEQSPVIAAMFRDGLYRASKDESLWSALGGRIECIEANSMLWLSTSQQVDVVYLDPMFPPKRKKSALPPGHIQIIQSIVGCAEPDESKQLLRVALQAASKRVVVKRPNHAPQISNNAVAIHRGKLVRYEVYRPELPS